MSEELYIYIYSLQVFMRPGTLLLCGGSSPRFRLTKLYGMPFPPVWEGGLAFEPQKSLGASIPRVTVMTNLQYMYKQILYTVYVHISHIAP